MVAVTVIALSRIAAGAGEPQIKLFTGNDESATTTVQSVPAAQNEVKRLRDSYKGQIRLQFGSGVHFLNETFILNASMSNTVLSGPGLLSGGL